MSKPFGLTTLMESIRYGEQQVAEENLVLDTMIGESAVSDDVKDEFIGDGTVDADMEQEDVDINDPELNKILSMIPESDDEGGLMDELEGMLESYIEGGNL